MVQNLFGMHKSGNHLLATMPPIWRLVYSNILFESVSRVAQYIYKELSYNNSQLHSRVTLCTGCPHPGPATDAAMWQIPKWEIQNKREKQKKRKLKRPNLVSDTLWPFYYYGMGSAFFGFHFYGFYLYCVCVCVCVVVFATWTRTWDALSWRRQASKEKNAAIKIQ